MCGAACIAMTSLPVVRCVNPSLLRLVDTLDAHLENNNLEVPPQLGELPDDITLAETVATWKYVVHFQEKQKLE